MRPEATYLAWLDCSKLGLSTSAFQFFLDKARIGFSAGETFDPDCPQFVQAQLRHVDADPG